MPALRVLGTEIPARMLGYLQTLPATNPSTSIAHGGRLYDDWQLEAGAHRQALAHPAYPRTAYYANDASMTWRCKSCHGFDYLGAQGNYSSGRYATGIKGIRAMAGVDPAQIAMILRNPTHQYGTVLKERDLQDLALFVSTGQVDMDLNIDRQTRRAGGDAAKGAAFYDTTCARCHGKDGKHITAPLGRLTRANPWGALHSMLNGHPDEKMPALRELDFRMLIDTLTYVQSLPDTR
jgi:cytochrome c553